MKKIVLKLVVTYLAFLVIFVFQKPLFLMFYPGKASMGDILDILSHGFSMDMSMAAYMTVVPFLLTVAGQWWWNRGMIIAERVYYAFSSVIIATTTVADLILYGYWGFRLDMTPVFYFMTSPDAAMASASTGEIILGVLATIVLGVAVYLLLRYTAGKIDVTTGGGWKRTATMVVIAGLLFLSIRGGVTVSTMNLSRVYYSQNQHFNHAAMNPLFSLIYSASHQGRWDEQYRFMSAEEADEAINQLNKIAIEPTDSAIVLTENKRPDIVLIILESFSSHLMPSVGGEAIAVKLDSIAATGLYFDNFYACSFRTDRALPSIMSGFPGLPSTSLMKNVDKIERTPSWPRELKHNGWDLSYYYGGDINFTNMKAYLVSQGFENIICDKDFSAAERSSKWGAHDHLVMNRALSDISRYTGDQPRLDVIQTSSSHEPFEVPYSNPQFADSPRKNAFAYTDSCLGAFVDSLAHLPRWAQTLVVIVPDHYGVYPQNLENPLERHHVPMVITGGALATGPLRVSRAGSQNDIAATILEALDIEADVFPFSKNMLDGNSPRYGVFTERSIAGVVTGSDAAVFNCDADADILSYGPDSVAVSKASRAILQHLYDKLSQM
ncbi:MAG: sulfatase-like hydrolase/transferase [Lachnoclostridium sp.]|nr:sulfatase-like hydrolase/transferase [Lachnoclostridium sp.]